MAGGWTRRQLLALPVLGAVVAACSDSRTAPASAGAGSASPGVLSGVHLDVHTDPG